MAERQEDRMIDHLKVIGIFAAGVLFIWGVSLTNGYLLGGLIILAGLGLLYAFLLAFVRGDIGM